MKIAASRRKSIALVLLLVFSVITFLFLSKRAEKLSPLVNRQNMEMARPLVEKSAVSSENKPEHIPVSKLPEVLSSIWGRSEYENVNECVMTGIVRTREAEPIPGATIGVYERRPDAGETHWPDAITTVTTDIRGKYEVRLASPVDNGVARVSKQGYATVVDVRSFHVPGRIEKIYELEKANACVEGLVVREGNVPVANAQVLLSVGLSSNVGLNTNTRVDPIYANSDNAGRFRIEGAPMTLVDVGARAQGLIPQKWSVALRLEEGPCKQLRLEMKAAEEITVSVVNKAGVGIPDAYAIGNLFIQSRADRFGNIKISFPAELEAETTDCVIGAMGYKLRSIVLKKSIEPVTIMLEDAEKLSGRVISKSLGYPVEGAQVSVIMASSASRRGTINPHPVLTDAEGKFSYPLAEPTVLEVRVRKTGYEDWHEVYSGKSRPSELLARLVEHHAGIFGRVIDQSLQPVWQFSVHLTDASSGKVYIRAYEDINGYFLVNDVPVGVYNMRFSRSSYNSHEVARMEAIPIKEGYYYGELSVRLLPLK